MPTHILSALAIVSVLTLSSCTTVEQRHEPAEHHTSTTHETVIQPTRASTQTTTTRTY